MSFIKNYMLFILENGYFKNKIKHAKYMLIQAIKIHFLLENEYSLGRVTFNKHLIIKLSIQNKWDWIPYTLPNEKT